MQAGHHLHEKDMIIQAAPTGAFANFHMRRGGASCWHWLLSGRQVYPCMLPAALYASLRNQIVQLQQAVS